MARIYAITSTTTVATVSGTVAAAASALVAAGLYQFVSSTACWIRQGTSKTITCVAKANLVDGETIKITYNGTTVTYEFDVNGTGVTAGNIQVNVSADTTAATVAARLKTAIDANQGTVLTTTNPGAGVLTVDRPDSIDLTITEQVADAGFTIGTGVMQATAGAGSQYLPANVVVMLKGAQGGQLGVIQDAAGGKSSTTRLMVE